MSDQHCELYTWGKLGDWSPEVGGLSKLPEAEAEVEGGGGWPGPLYLWASVWQIYLSLSFMFSQKSTSSRMSREQLHHREVLLERGVKGGLGERSPWHRRHWTFGPACNYYWLEQVLKIIKKNYFRVEHIFLYFQLRFICSFGSEPVPLGGISSCSSPNATNALSFTLFLFLLTFQVILTFRFSSWTESRFASTYGFLCRCNSFPFQKFNSILVFWHHLLT